MIKHHYYCCADELLHRAIHQSSKSVPTGWFNEYNWCVGVYIIDAWWPVLWPRYFPIRHWVINVKTRESVGYAYFRLYKVNETGPISEINQYTTFSYHAPACDSHARRALIGSLGALHHQQKKTRNFPTVRKHKHLPGAKCSERATVDERARYFGNNFIETNMVLENLPEMIASSEEKKKVFHFIFSTNARNTLKVLRILQRESYRVTNLDFYIFFPFSFRFSHLSRWWKKGDELESTKVWTNWKTWSWRR